MAYPTKIERLLLQQIVCTICKTKVSLDLEGLVEMDNERMRKMSYTLLPGFATEFPSNRLLGTTILRELIRPEIRSINSDSLTILGKTEEPSPGIVIRTRN